MQYGVAAGFTRLDRSFYEDLSLEYTNKRDWICGALTRARLLPYVPQGAYYVLASVSSLPGKNSKEKAMFLLERTGVASVPGEAFSHNGGGKDLVRFCFAKTERELQEACIRLERLFFETPTVSRHRLPVSWKRLKRRNFGIRGETKRPRTLNKPSGIGLVYKFKEKLSRSLRQIRCLRT
ncbi:MAG TPA: aminotransferase class I/II-fold pyridoxal phosphate-dependent enzyme [Candidatus Polarisedimenticolia bacterium]|nr:aminotransferase class I/II-fold pyridoxal phosphate-dependent enzyme [Candidatus Polarisedimenticolia bacterium]